MSILHHPDDATLLSYSAGSLSESFETLVSCHLQQCDQCRQRVANADYLGAVLLESAKPRALAQGGGREAFVALLDEEADKVSFLGAAEDSETIPGGLPEPLQRLINEGDINLPWRRLVPGIQQIQLSSGDGTLRLLKIAADTAMPMHSHGGSEMTLIIEGSYRDSLGEFRPGDVADVHDETEHQPVTGPEGHCICLVATDAPLRFRGFLPKLLQPFTGL